MTDSSSLSSSSLNPLRVIIGADHRGMDTAQRVQETLTQLGYQASIIQACEGSSDYPEQAYAVGHEMNAGNADRGVLICGTGIGMSIAANKVNGLRAALVHDELTAQLSRSHNDANVLCLSADLLGERLIDKVIEVWMNTEFEGGRHKRRVDKITAIQDGLDPCTTTESPTS
ncbi:MAG: ribose 5-phosphate isomerase B [Phycisphaerales bacterium]|nr:ribose 5-phosphate isomerase B [Phycisphaerales bacterium]